MSTAAGHQAEAVAAVHLRRLHHTILAQNWRTRWCEIDIVSQKDGFIYFVECKYRTQNTWGGGLEYITRRKLQQMQFAAEFWIAKHKITGSYHLAAMELSGSPPRVSAWLDDIF